MSQLHVGDCVVLADGVPLDWLIEHTWGAVDAQDLDDEARQLVRDFGIYSLDRNSGVRVCVVGRVGTARVRVAVEQSLTLVSGQVITKLEIDVPIQALQHATPEVSPRSFTSPSRG